MSTASQPTDEETEAIAALPETLAIAGSGTIACGLAASAARHGEVTLLVRSVDSAARARATVDKICGRLSGEVNAAQVKIVTDHSEVGHATYVVEAVIENHAAKADLLGKLHGELAEDAILATTTSSLSIEKLGEASERPERFAGLHVFNPVPRMKLVELVYPTGATPDTRARTLALCNALGKTPVEVPDIPGFVVNRLLFPFLFSAVRLLEETGMAPEDIDTCMTLGAGHPMGPLALLDLVGLDVSEAIGETIGEPVPERVYELIEAGHLGRKTGQGFHQY
jgi:3-hydroxybutyryl-CoA dehydrogenase